MLKTAARFFNEAKSDVSVLVAFPMPEVATSRW
jgi:hypothetical protein